MHVTQSLHRAYQQAPDRLSTVFGERSRTVAESHGRVARLAGALRGLGVRPGDRVGIVALNSDRYHELLLGVPWAGGAVNPVNTRWSATEIAFSLADCQTNIIVVDDTFATLVPELRTRAPNLRTVVFCGEGDAPDGALDYEELIADTAPVKDALRGGDDLYGVFYTGGTTGRPKGVMLSHDNIVTSALGSIATTEVMTRCGVLLHAAPMFHLADLAAWSIGCLLDSTHVVVPSFTAAEVVETILHQGVTDTLLVPTMIQMLVDSPEAQEADLTSMRKVLYGASPIAEAVLQRARRILPNAQFTQAYGMTELAPIATLLTPADHDDQALVRACGRAVTHAMVQIMDEQGTEVPRGTVGEICVRGENVMQGYWNLPDATEAALHDGGWMRTGDGGYMNDDGYVFVVDRIKDMIVTGGENVYSAEVENAIAKHPSILQVAVIGVPDDEWGERVHAVVVCKDGQSISAGELRDFCREHIASYKLPRSLAIVDSLPISGAGKVLKRELRRKHWAESARAIR